MRLLRHRLPERRLFLRVYLHGLSLLVGLAVACLAVFALVGDPHAWHQAGQRFAAAIARNLDGGATGQERIGAQLALASEALGGTVAVFDQAGRRLAASGVGAPTALPGALPQTLEERAIVHVGSHPFAAYALRSPAGRRGYLLLDFRSAPDSTRLLALVLTVLAVLGVMSWPLARAISRPVEQLTATAKRLAAGELSARTGIERCDEVGALARAMDEMAARLEQRLRADKELLASISHEFRTPLSRMRVALELCEEGAAAGELAPAALAGIAEDVGELERLVSDVLTVAKLALTSETGGASGFVARQEELALGPFLAELAQRFRSRHPERVLALEAASAPREFFADGALLRRLVENLLDNSAKYADPAAPIELVVQDDGDALVLEVRDRGPLLPPADLARLFEPFFRGERSRSRAAGGVGLGLALCRAIAVAHGGSISAHSREGGGLVVSVRLP